MIKRESFTRVADSILSLFQGDLIVSTEVFIGR